MLLPAWHVPELNKWIKIPDGADREDSDDSDGDGENALPALNASELAVTRSIALSITNCGGTTTSVKARMLMAQMSDLTSNYVEGEGGRKVSTAKQLAVALSSKCVKDTTVLLVKPKHDAPFVSTKVPAIQGISNFYAVEYDEKNQLVPSVTKTLARAPPSSTSENPFGHSGINFTGCKVVLHNLGTEKAISRVRSRYKHRSRSIIKQQINKEELGHKDNMALKEICAIYPRCERCLYHFANNYKLKNHRCNGDQVRKDAITLAMVYANSLLATRDFSVSGQATAMISSTIVLGKPTYSSFEGNFFPG